MSRRVHFTAIGRLPVPAYAMRDDFETPIEAVVRAIARHNGLGVCAGPRSDGQAVRRGEVEARHYAATFGRRCRIGGGWTPVAELIIVIDESQFDRRNIFKITPDDMPIITSRKDDDQ